MAIRYAVANGVWSNTATWDGGTLPASNDDVFSNNRTVTIDQNITAITLRNTSNVSPVVTAGGQFIVTGNTGTRIITLTDVTTGIRSNGLTFGTVALVVNSTSGATVTINSAFNNPGSVQAFFCNGSCVLNLVGNSNATYGPLLNTTTSANGGTLNILGNITGSIFGGNTSIVIGSTTYTINITGNVTGNADSVLAVGASNVANITGNITTIGIAAVGVGVGSTLNVTGNITSAGAAAVTSTSNCVITVNGNVTASSAAVGILSTNVNALVTVNGNLINTNDIMAVQSFKMRISPTSQQAWTFQTAGPNRQMFTANAFSGGTMPVASDVRLGVSYANGTLTGTCAVPSANSVVWGVPVDNTVGNAVITRAQLFSDTGAIIAAYPQIN